MQQLLFLRLDLEIADGSIFDAHQPLMAQNRLSSLIRGRNGETMITLLQENLGHVDNNLVFHLSLPSPEITTRFKTSPLSSAPIR